MSAATSSRRSSAREARVAQTLRGAMPPLSRFWPCLLYTSDAADE